ncbi:MAG: hypothetical protein ACTSVE_10465 [Candidatus Helarchaeota archaeon]
MSLLTPIDLIGLIIILIVMVEVFILTIILFRKYGESKAEITLFFALMFLFLLLAVIFLILEQVSYRILYNNSLGGIFAWIALLSSGTAGLWINMIALELTFPDRKWFLVIPIMILVAILLTISGWAIFMGEPWSFVEDAELFYYLPIQITSYCLLIPVLFNAPIVFIYYSIINREDKSAAARGIWMAVAIALFGIAYMIEVAPIEPFISVPMRVAYIISATILYVTFTRSQSE